MLKDYPATQLFLISAAVLLALVLLTPLVKEMALVSAMLSSIKFIVKVVCGFFLLFTIIDIIDGFHSHKQHHIH
ncbi:MAG: hypothetical protein H6Q72_2355 [Firmicutes bacterium]|nr:hypothetical protein [Bacillota bacterium]